MREIISNEWFTVLIILCIGILTFVKVNFSKRFVDFLWVIGNSKYLKIYLKDQKFIDRFDGFLFFNLIISLSLFFFIVYNALVETVDFNFGLFIKILVGVGAIILIKILLERLANKIKEWEKTN